MSSSDVEFYMKYGEQEDEYQRARNIALRKYQIKLLEKAKTSNSIIYLPTGSGKTLIAIHTLCSRSSDIMRSYGEGGKRAFFLSTTKVMAYQLTRVLRIHTKFKIACFTGDMDVDSWSQKIWINHFETNHVIVLTAEVLKQLLQLGFIDPTVISLIVFDECHHAVAEHPYRLILKIIAEIDPSKAPLLLGLTSVLLNSNPKKGQILQLIRGLEAAFRGKIITEDHHDELLCFATNVSEKVIHYREVPTAALPETVLQLYDSIIEVLRCFVLNSSANPIIPKEGKEYKNKNKVKRIINAFVNSKRHFEELGIFGGSLSALFSLILFEKWRLLSNDPDEIQILIYARTELYKVRHALQKIIGEESAASIISFSSPKVQNLVNILKELKEHFQKKHFSSLVFVYQKVTAVLLAFLLNRLSALDERYSFVKADFAAGSSLMTKETSIFETKNEEVIKKLASRSLNLLVATNLLEEGIDIPTCNVVINFDFPLSYTSYFQCKGRARDKESYYFIFLKDSEIDEKSQALNWFRNIEKEILMNVYCDLENIKEESMDDSEKLSLPKKSGMIVVDGLIAIKAVNRYCSKLPQDKFSHLSPTAWYIEEEESKKAFVQLPINCPLLEVIEGKPRKNSRLAKRSAFLAALKRLYEMGELDEELNPKVFEVKEKNFKNLFPHFKNENIPSTMPQAGTKKRKQLYKLNFAECLSSCLPQPGVKTYIHVINLSVMFDKPRLDRKVAIYDILQTSVTYAILSTKRLCRIFQFPLFIDMGQINCDLLVNYDEIILTESELNDIKTCHFALFKKITKSVQNSQVFDDRNREHSFLVVPVEKNEEGRFVLNWNIIRSDFCKNNNLLLVKYNPSLNVAIKRFKSNLNHEILNHEELFNGNESNSLAPTNTISNRFLWEVSQYENNSEPKFTMTEADYKYFIVIPNYRKQDPPQCYIVNKFCQDMSPLSPFPRIEFKDYLTYYKDKYLIEITNTRQPLLRVSPLYNCVNFNKPRNRKPYRAKEKCHEYEEHLIPELCEVIPFDRKYWVKALLLPTILNRIYHVFCVEEFRKKIVSETGLGFYELPEGTSWKPLEVISITADEEKQERASNFTDLDLNVSLPLSKLKDKAQADQKVILDPGRNIYNVGLCDLEFYTKYLEKNFVSENEINSEANLKNDEIIKLISMRNISVPTLEIFKNKRNGLGPDLAQLVQACTAKSANDIVDYERLEILGDSFLKFAVTLFLFRNYPDNEGVLTSVKGKIVGNQNLLYCGVAKNIQDVINVSEFVPMFDWNPPLFCVPERLVDGIIFSNVDPAVLYRFDIPPEEQFSGILSEHTFRKNEEILRNFEKCCDLSTSSLLPYKTIQDKTISDCVEAFIGAYLFSLGLPGAFELLLWLGILPKAKGSYSELIEKPYKVLLLNSEGDPMVMNMLNEVFYSDLEDTLNYQFKNKALLLEALTHPSYCINRVTSCFQRLEFLGDAVLDFLITSYIYESCGNLTPGQVTDIRSSLVNNLTFACLVVRFELHKYLLSFNSTLNRAIENFVSFQVNRNHVVDDNTLILLEENDCMIAEAVQVPKALGDLFESLAGAIYLDSGNSLKTVWDVYYKLMKRELDKFVQIVPKTAVRLLQEICDHPYYETTVVQGMTKVSCSVYYENREIKAHGFGVSKKDGKQSAAKLVLNKILALKT